MGDPLPARVGLGYAWGLSTLAVLSAFTSRLAIAVDAQYVGFSGDPFLPNRMRRRRKNSGMTIRRTLLLPALTVALTTCTSLALAKPDASTKSDASAKVDDNEDLVRMAEGLLDNGDLVRMGANLLDEDAGFIVDAGVEASADAQLEAGDDTADAELASVPEAGDLPDRDALDGALVSADLPASSGSDPSAPTPDSRGPAGGVSRSARIQSGANVDPQGPKDSPFAKLGVPPAAVPVVATAATAGAMAIWPFLIKTLTGLLKGVIGGLLKSRAKKNQKVDTTQRAFVIAGFVLRPLEIASLFAAALIYGLAVCYTMQGWKMALPFVRMQELLVVAIYFSRSVVRFVYERSFKLTTQYKLWIGGGLLCLGSAYLGNTLGTVGYELEAAKEPEDAKRIIKMKVWLLVLALVMAVGFCIANLHAPAKILQSGRLMMSGMALGEVMPINPMPGLKIYKWRKDVWALLFVLVVPTFFLINLVL